MSRKTLRLMSKITGTIATAITFVMGCIIGVSSFLYLGGMRVMYVVSNSMVPAFAKGDAIVASKNFENVSSGDMIAYQADWVSAGSGKDIVTHRVVDVSNGMVTAQGDANAAPDPTFPLSDVYGQIVATYDNLGYLFNPTTVFALTAIAFVLIVLSYRWSLGTRGKHSIKRNTKFSNFMTYKLDKLGF